MSDHTPGPWEWKAGPVGGGYLIVYSPSYRAATDAEHVVCELRVWQRPSPNADRDLICAAPELLAALIELVDYDEGSSEEGDYGYEVLHRCKAAINKAKGTGQQ